MARRRRDGRGRAGKGPVNTSNDSTLQDPDQREQDRLRKARRPDVLEILERQHPPKMDCFFADFFAKRQKTSFSEAETIAKARGLLHLPFSPSKKRIQTRKDITKGLNYHPISAYDDVEERIEDCEISITKSLNFTFSPEPKIVVDHENELTHTICCKCVEGCYQESCECIQQSARGLFDSSVGRIIRRPDYADDVIYLCSTRCRCRADCNNHFPRTNIRFECFRRDPVLGYGLRTLSSIVQGEIVLQFTGEVIEDGEEYLSSRQDTSLLYSFLIFEQNYVDPYFEGNQARFITHSRGANLAPVRVAFHGIPIYKEQIFLAAGESIMAGCELSFDYGDAYVEQHLKRRCLCRFPLCSTCFPEINNFSHEQFKAIFLARERLTRARIKQHEDSMRSQYQARHLDCPDVITVEDSDDEDTAENEGANKRCENGEGDESSNSDGVEELEVETDEELLVLSTEPRRNKAPKEEVERGSREENSRVRSDTKDESSIPPKSSQRSSENPVERSGSEECGNNSREEDRCYEVSDHEDEQSDHCADDTAIIASAGSTDTSVVGQQLEGDDEIEDGRNTETVQSVEGEKEKGQEKEFREVNQGADHQGNATQIGWLENTHSMSKTPTEGHFFSKQTQAFPRLQDSLFHSLQEKSPARARRFNFEGPSPLGNSNESMRNKDSPLASDSRFFRNFHDATKEREEVDVIYIDSDDEMPNRKASARERQPQAAMSSANGFAAFSSNFAAAQRELTKFQEPQPQAAMSSVNGFANFNSNFAAAQRAPTKFHQRLWKYPSTALATPISTEDISLNNTRNISTPRVVPAIDSDKESDVDSDDEAGPPASKKLMPGQVRFRNPGGRWYC